MADTRIFNPFPGLRPFGAEEDYLFFGREEQTRELLQLLRTHRFLAVVGTSGSGKSSLVRAGLLPALYGGTMVGAGSDWSTVVFRPGGDPLLNLAEAMIEADLDDPEDDEAPLRIRATLSRSRLGLVQSVRQSDLPEGNNLLIVVDQFEELFRFRDTSPDHQSRATAFVKLLLNAVAAPELPIYVAITMRSDYLGDCAQLPGLAEAVNDGEYLIPKLTRDQKRDAIEKPVAVGGGQISPALVQQLLNDVGDDADQLPILQHVLMRIWDRWNADHAEAEPIDLRHYDAVGGMDNALSLHADEVYDELLDDNSRTLAMRIFQAITERGEDERGTRRPTRLSHLCDIVDGRPDEVTGVLDAYRQAGRTFVMPGPEVDLQPETVIDISHESLMRVWQRLRSWVAEESQSVRIYRRLAETAALHAEDEAGVYRDPDLQIATSWRDASRPTEAWARRYHAGFQTAMGFLDQSWETAHAEEEAREAARQRELDQAKKLAESERRRAEVQVRARKRLYVLLAGISAALLVAVGMYVYAEGQRKLAEKNEQLATTALADKEAADKRLAERQRVDDLASARTLFEQGDVPGALKTLQAASQREPGEPVLTRQAMQYISRHSFFAEIRSTNPPATIGENSRLFPLPTINGLAIAGTSGELSLIQNSGEFKTATFESPVIRCTAGVDCLQVLTEQGAVHCWWPDDNRQVSLQDQLSKVDESPQVDTEDESPQVEKEDEFPQAFTPDSVTFHPGHILTHSNHTVRVVAVGGDHSLSIIKQITLTEEEVVRKAILTDDLTRLCLVDQDNKYRLFDLTGKPTELRSLPAQSDVVFMAELPLQNKLLAVERAGLVQLIDSTNPKLDMILDLDDAAFSARQFLVSPDSTRLAILSGSGDVSLYSLASGSPFFTQQENSSFPFEAIVFDPAGIVIAGADADGHVTVIDSETGRELVSPSIATMHPGSLYFPAAVDSDGRERQGLRVAGITISSNGDRRMADWQLVPAAPDEPDLLPDVDAIDLSGWQPGDHARFFSYWINQIASHPAGVRSVRPASFTQFVLNRADQTQNSLVDPAAIAGFWKDRAASGEPLSLARAFLAGHVNPQILAATMTMPGGPVPDGNLSARYHHILFLMDYFRLTESDDFSTELLRRLARYGNLLEARSMAYADQVHVGPTITLDSAEHVGSWDGLGDRFTIEEGSISTPDLEATWNGTDNQFVIWRGADFADFRVKFVYRIDRGNSGVLFRGTAAVDPGETNGAGRLHEYLERGYQVDLRAPDDPGFGSSAGMLMVENFTGQRGLHFAKRGDHAVARRNGERLIRQLTPDTPSHNDLLSVLASAEAATVTVEARRQRIDTTANEVHLSTGFDFHPLRRLSGSISFQSRRIDAILDVSGIEVNRLGRDLAEAELSRSGLDRRDLDRRLACDLLWIQKRWNELATELEGVLAADEGGDWAGTMLRDVNIRRRDTQRRLARACQENDVQAVRQIIDEVADPELLNRLAHENVGDIGKGTFMGTPALAAANTGSLDVLKLLVENGLKIDQPAGTHGFVVAHGALIANQPMILKYLLEQGCNPNGANRFRFALVQEAARWAGPECMQMLLDAGALVDYGAGAGATAIQIVSKSTGDVRNYSNDAASGRWSSYAASDRRIEVARLLIEAGLKPDRRYGSRPSAIQHAVNVGDTELAEFLRSQVE